MSDFNIDVDEVIENGVLYWILPDGRKVLVLDENGDVISSTQVH